MTRETLSSVIWKSYILTSTTVCLVGLSGSFFEAQLELLVGHSYKLLYIIFIYVTIHTRILYIHTRILYMYLTSLPII